MHFENHLKLTVNLGIIIIIIIIIVVALLHGLLIKAVNQ